MNLRISRFSRFVTVFLLLCLSAVSLCAQKGIDNQTQKIKEEANKNIPNPMRDGQGFDWGKGKTPVRTKLANPYKLAARRDVLIENVRAAVKERRLLVDEQSSRPADGIIVTQPFVFAKGAVIARSELARYGVLEFEDRAWSRGQYTLIIEVQPIDGIQNNVSVTAKVEGRSGTGLTSEWVTVQSSGLAEDEFLVKLVELVTGKSVVDTDNNEE